MNIALIITSILSLATLIVSIYNARTLNENKEKDRRIAVELSEKRRVQNELMNHITKVLDLGRRCRVETDENNKQKMKFELLNHKIFIWINLDRNNCVHEDLREQCNIYINFCASSLEVPNREEQLSYLDNANKNFNFILQLIDRYIEEENKLIEELM
ncbi:hypothetical protein CN639_01250 [Bacillus toyonensis]|uniref:hypothetical protein n=1 Tax=Bacillus toyonensis TaxID=155322 RepID=UPI000BF19B9D|nr:hypothetical protein [Bacillus toyonensis]PEM95197.1 hypothetical protein CN639_01250 [Bacillus toyonensis]PGB16518.1 hypothetical protein COL96_08220 [Bacillus toyonensis]PGE14212.1 hypothetical protein COM54_03870 [Bacillus toyonensis]